MTNSSLTTNNLDEEREFETGAAKGDTGPPQFDLPPTRMNYQEIADLLVSTLNVPCEFLF
jgi:hypothetical protein